MRRRRNGVFLTVAAAVAITLVSIAPAAANGAGKNFEDRPLKGRSEGVSTVTGIANGVVTVVSTGDLKATHFGNGTYTAATMQNYALHPDNQCAFVFGEVTLTAGNGDELHLEVVWQHSVVCAPEDQPATGPEEGDVYLSTLYLDVVGGKGKFTDAEGWVFSRGTHEVTEVVSVTLDAALLHGSIDY